MSFQHTTRDRKRNTVREKITDRPGAFSHALVVTTTALQEFGGIVSRFRYIFGYLFERAL